MKITNFEKEKMNTIHKQRIWIMQTVRLAKQFRDKYAIDKNCP